MIATASASILFLSISRNTVPALLPSGRARETGSLRRSWQARLRDPDTSRCLGFARRWDSGNSWRGRLRPALGPSASARYERSALWRDLAVAGPYDLRDQRRRTTQRGHHATGALYWIMCHARQSEVAANETHDADGRGRAGSAADAMRRERLPSPTPARRSSDRSRRARRSLP